MWHTSHVL
ncbi:hypothetical protein Zm00014a_011880 [Zea mays]|uniref:Uncharacterized protein n=1 Tax=Zea mays TaxID=4577 RepID=A0A317YEI8_MAIZE|nr:hypothetical protein Zm00014a_011880 [Zea mays]